MLATDCGHVVNPDQVVAQIEGSVAYGLGATLYQECTLKNGRIVEENFDTYPMMLMEAFPKIETVVVPSGGFWGGVGEPTIAWPRLPCSTPSTRRPASRPHAAPEEREPADLRCGGLDLSVLRRCFRRRSPRRACERLRRRTPWRSKATDPASADRPVGRRRPGREIAFNRELGNCIVCHIIPAPDDRAHGDVGPSLRAAGRRAKGRCDCGWSTGAGSTPRA